MLNNADRTGGSGPTCYTWVRSDLLLTQPPPVGHHTGQLRRQICLDGVASPSGPEGVARLRHQHPQVRWFRRHGRFPDLDACHALKITDHRRIRSACWSMIRRNWVISDGFSPTAGSSRLSTDPSQRQGFSIIVLKQCSPLILSLSKDEWTVRDTTSRYPPAHSVMRLG